MCAANAPSPVSTRLTDSVSAAGVALVVWVARRRGESAARETADAAPFFLGVIAAVVIELVFARWPERAARLWRRPAVHVGSPIGLAVGTLLASRRHDGAPSTVVLGGLAGYAALLVGIVSGIIPEPASWFGSRRRGDPDGDG